MYLVSYFESIVKLPKERMYQFPLWGKNLKSVFFKERTWDKYITQKFSKTAPLK